MEEMYQSEVRERLVAFITSKGLSFADFCRTVGVRLNFVSSINKGIRQDKLLRISRAYPELSMAWLVTGEGQMLKSGVAPTVQPPAAPVEPQQPTDNTLLQFQLQAAQKEIDSLNALIAELREGKAELKEGKAKLEKANAKLEAERDDLRAQLDALLHRLQQ